MKNKTKNLRDLVLLVAGLGAAAAAVDIKLAFLGIGAAALINFYDRYANGKR